jgi:queuine tRNA-ribosyltransferase
MSHHFELQKTSSAGRQGRLQTAHGMIETPFFMPIATKGAVKAVTPEDLTTLGASMILSNTYHLMLQPGMEVLAAAGGLHSFMKWGGPILTDSGGYQVFSLAPMRKISDVGVQFKSHLDGSSWTLSPEDSIHIQQTIGSDIAMVLDECPPHDAPRAYVKQSLELTSRWAKRSKEAGAKKPDQQLFGIVQGGVHADLRQESANQITALDFDGYAIGGLAVGETPEEMFAMTEVVTALLPEDRPRYFMGGARPEQLIQLVQRGVDMFDCVIPTRNARHGQLFIWTADDLSGAFYKTVNIKNATLTRDFSPIDARCACMTCATFSRAYLHHLYNVQEPLYLRLATIHNLKFYFDLLRKIRERI